jgi:RNA polymerase sigma-70 factor (ECF subfamily)
MIGAMADQLDTTVQTGAELRDFGAWMASEQRRIFLLCRRMLQDEDEADTATQDAFLKAHRALSKGKDLAAELDSPAKWVTRIAVNTCLDRLRSKSLRIWRRRPAPEDEAVILGMAATGEPSAEDRLFAQQIQQRLEVALARLSHRQRAVFLLRHYEAMPLEEIAGVLKLDVGTVKAHLFRSLTKLRELLADLHTARTKGVRGKT